MHRSNEFVRARAPIPAVGVIGRGYVAEHLDHRRIQRVQTAEGIDEDDEASTSTSTSTARVNFTDNFGAQFGYRSLDVSYTVETDEGELKIKGPYLGGVVRF